MILLGDGDCSLIPADTLWSPKMAGKSNYLPMMFTANCCPYFPWFSGGFPLVFLRFSAGFPMVFLGFPMVSQPPPGHLALGMPSTVIWDLVARDLSPEVSSAASPETTVDDVDG